MLPLPLDGIDKDYLLSLVSSAAQETISLDFKKDMYHLPEKKAEMLHDISAMANSEGGDILIGVEEEKKGSVWVAKDVPGIENASQHRLTVEQTCAIHISPRISGLRVRPVNIGDNKAVLVVRVPPSIHAPHAVTFQDEDRFWIRTGAEHKRHMTCEEVRRACLREREQYPSSEKRLEELLAWLRRGIRGDSVRLNLVAVPVPPRDGLVSVTRDDIKEALVGAWSDVGPTDYVRPDIDGLFAPLGRGDSPGYHAQVKRDGSVLWAGLESLGIVTDVDLAMQQLHNTHKARDLLGVPTLRIIENFLGFVKTLWELVDHYGPSLCCVALDGLNATGLRTKHSISTTDGTFADACGSSVVEVRRELPSEFDVDMVLHDIADRIWNAWHLDRCELFEADGRGAWHNASS